MKNLNYNYINYLIKLIIAIYLTFSFINWSFNPEKWGFITRIIAFFLFAINTNQDKK